MGAVLLILALAVFVVHESSCSCPLITIEDYEDYAVQNLPYDLRLYLQRGSGHDVTVERNTRAFSKVQVLPRYLRDVSNRTTETTALGKPFKLPVGISPSGLHKRWTPEGELATVRAVQSTGTILIVSAVASFLFEDIAKEAPDAEKWLQIPLFDNRTYTYNFIQRVEESGYGALVVLVDSPVTPLRYFVTRNNYKYKYPLVNFETFGENIQKLPSRMSATWAYLKEVINTSKLPVILKGILSPADAKLARASGARGIIVSNHGGRALDGTISTMEALANIIREVPSDDNFEIYLDGGVRNGLDVFRALALGAKFVFVGRPGLWGLFHSGQAGLENVLEIFRNELETNMGYAGVVSTKEINSSYVSYNFNDL